jgi:hypothetical protein
VCKAPEYRKNTATPSETQCKKKKCDEDKDICCEKLPECKNFPAGDCAAGTTLNKGSGGFFGIGSKGNYCPDIPCTVTDCCKDNQMCADFVGKNKCGNDYIANPDIAADPAMKCAKEACKKDECCKKLPKCDKWAGQCDPGRSLGKKKGGLFGIGASAIVCASLNGCTELECCRDNGKCADFKCDDKSVKLVTTPPPQCAKFKCKEKECCDKLPTCSPKDPNGSYGGCPSHMILKDGGMFDKLFNGPGNIACKTPIGLSPSRTSATTQTTKSAVTTSPANGNAGAVSANSGVGFNTIVGFSPIGGNNGGGSGFQLSPIGGSGFQLSPIGGLTAPLMSPIGSNSFATGGGRRLLVSAMYECTDNECCDMKDDCANGFDCGTQHHTSLSPASPCAKKKCKRDECCSKNPMCDNSGYACADADKHLRQALNIICKLEKCEDTDCCQPNGKCDGFQCPLGFHAVSDASTKTCPHKICPYTLCCNANQKCDTFQCPAGWNQPPAFKAGSCRQEPCADKDCCVPNQKCGAYTCAVGLQHPIAGISGNDCADAMCTKTECCDDNPKCNDSGQHDCPTGQYAPTGAITCRLKKCEDSDCCAPNQKCGAAFPDCPKLSHPTSGIEFIPCKDEKCVPDDCCQDNPKCGTFDCPTMFFDLDGNKNKKCEGTACAVKDCCQPNPFCGPFDCGTFVDRPNMSAIQCRGIECKRPDCCVTPTKIMEVTWLGQVVKPKGNIHFGGTIVKGTPTVQTLTLKNKGNSELKLLGGANPIELKEGGVAKNDYSVDQPRQKAIPPGGEVTIAVTFAPKTDLAVSERPCKLTIRSDDMFDNKEFMIDITAIAATHHLQVFGGASPQTANEIEHKAVASAAKGTVFASMAALKTSQAVTKTFYIKNAGKVVLKLTSPVKLSGDRIGSFTITQQPPMTIGAGQMAPFRITFVAEEADVFEAKVEIESEDFDTPRFKFTITGTGSDACDLGAKKACKDVNAEGCKPGAKGAPVCGAALAGQTSTYCQVRVHVNVSSRTLTHTHSNFSCH